MRRLLLCVLIAFGLAAAEADAASLDPARIAAVDQAAGAFLAKAAAAKKNGMVPRQSDPDVGPLLDTVFDTRELSHGTLPYADFDKLRHWLEKIAAVGNVYLAASQTVRDFGLFGPEMGRFFDAAFILMQASADCMTAELDAHPDGKLPPAELRAIGDMRRTISGNFAGMIGGFRKPGLSGEWVRDRVIVLIGVAPSLARFLKPDELARLRATTMQVAVAIRNKTLREMLGGVAVALAEPPPPRAATGEAAPSSDEIALEGDGRSYSVPVRVNGALTVKFIVDSGASVVALPQDLVDTLTKSGALAASDVLGHSKYVAADGKRHKGTNLMLRRLEVGGHTVTNVMASVLPAHADPLLGQSFLAKFRSWTLDNRRHVLIISE